MTKHRIILSLFAICLYTMALASMAGSATPIDTRLEKAKNDNKLVMLELGSVGCIPCEQMKPVMEKLTRTYGRHLEVIFVDIKRDRESAKRFRVFGIPTQVFLDRSGKEIHRHVGFYSYEQIVPVLKRAGI